ncbi:hypothetical protein FH972_022231 [Carpinus fangiana]|uniref:General transcription factor IIH subunit n=1 Tax=Carpinus fangiana TaxID=176857 RepID=A0A5N6KRZ8_9ROSI|nr:hypothetical protein FH972_022231 [Carpinus fangiana]
MMSDSDDDFVVAGSGDEDARATDAGARTRSAKPKEQGRQKERWEDIQRSWEVTEDPHGSIAGTVADRIEAEKRKRLLRDTTPLQRGIIRHLILVIDCSSAMLEKDLRPSRYLLTIRYSCIFVTEFFEQNPISQLAIIGMRDGLAESISPMSGNPAQHITALQALKTREPDGNPSLQNALDMARATLFHAPSHGTREALIIYGALLSADPGDIHSTIRGLVTDSIRCSVVGLAARIAICTELVSRTNAVTGASSDSPTLYGVAMNDVHYKDLFMAHTTPPVLHAKEKNDAPSLLMMGFPSRILEDAPSKCACHGNESRSGYLCSRCSSKVCTLPAQCPACDLQLIQSTHLARSYHHLFPLRNYVEVSWRDARAKESLQCFACLDDFPEVPSEEELQQREKEDKERREKEREERDQARKEGRRWEPKGRGWRGGGKGASESWRYRCTTCGEHFCVDCDVFAHEVVHNCAGCLCSPPLQQQANGEVNGTANGHV